MVKTTEGSTLTVLGAMLHNYMIAAAFIPSPKTLNGAILRVLNEKKYKGQEVDFVFNEVSTAFNIPRRKLMDPYAKGDVCDAKIMCYALFKNTLGLSMRTIAKQIFDHQHNTIANGLKTFDTIKKQQFKTDKKFMETYESIRLKIVDFK